MRIAVAADFHPIEAFLFDLDSGNPSAISYCQYLKYLMSGMIGYSFLAYIFSLEFNPDDFGQLATIGLGIAGILCGNPFAYLTSDGDEPDIVGHVLMATFIGFLRLFLVHNLESIRSNQTGFSLVLMWVLLVLGYGMVDVKASYEREVLAFANPQERFVMTQMEFVRLVLSLLYIACSLGLVWLTAKVKESSNSRRFGFFAGSTVASNCCALLAHVLILWRKSEDVGVKIDLGFQSAHAAIAAMAVFFLHAGVEQEYRAVGEAPFEANVIGVEALARGEVEDESSDTEGDESTD
jgi:hypothetical protein